MELAAGVGEPGVGRVRHPLDEAQRVGVAVGQGQRVVLRGNREQLLVLSEEWRNVLDTSSPPLPYNVVQGGPSALGKRYVDSKLEVAFSSNFIL